MPSVMDILRTGFGGMAPAPAVPSDGTMQPTIGPGTPAPATPQAPVKMGLPPGGILGLLQGQTPQGLMGLLARAQQQPGGVFGMAQQAGMLPGTPGSAMAGPVAPPQQPVQLPNVNPADQY